MVDPSLQRLLDREALCDLGIAYCAALDRADGDWLVSLFHPDGVVITGEEEVAIRAYAATTMAAVLSGTAATHHATSNQRFAFDGDRATGEAYVRVASLVPGAGGCQSLSFAGRYLDRFERRGGVWRFSSRTYVNDWSHARPAALIPDLPFLTGARGDADPGRAYAIRAGGQGKHGEEQ